MSKVLLPESTNFLGIAEEFIKKANFGMTKTIDRSWGKI